MYIYILHSKKIETLMYSYILLHNYILFIT